MPPLATLLAGLLLLWLPAVAGLRASAPRTSLYAATAFQSPAQGTPSFRAQTEAVVLDVSVLDANRRPVRGLTAADFTVLEDGRPETIATFSAIDVDDRVSPAAPRWVREGLSDVRSNDELKDHRVVVILMDGSTPMDVGETTLAKRMAESVVDQLGPDDVAAVVYTFGKAAGQDFTNDRARLRAAVNRFTASIPSRGFSFSAFDAMAQTLYQTTLATLRGVAESLAALPERRKALFFVSVGLPIDVGRIAEGKQTGDGDAGGQTWDLINDIYDLLAAAQRSNVSIYGLDPGGLRIAPSPKNQEFLTTVSEATGGFPILNQNDPKPGIAQIYRENASYYLLGYQPANRRTEGRFRKIEVRVNRPGVTIRTRNGYVEPRTRKAATPPRGVSHPSAENALVGVLPATGLSLRLTAAPFAGAQGDRADVAVAVEAAEPRTDGIKTAGEVELVVNAYDTQARLQASERTKVGVNFPASGRGEIRYGVLSLLALKPGRYQLRVAAESSLSGNRGSVYYDLDVPNFGKQDLALSGVVLDVSPHLLSVPRDRLSSLTPLVPSAERAFAAGSEAVAFARVYSSGTANDPVHISWRIVDASGTEVFGTTARVTPSGPGRMRAADCSTSLPISDLPVGQYLLTITARLGKAVAERAVPFVRR
jgi:VWFA-related protein